MTYSQSYYQKNKDKWKKYSGWSKENKERCNRNTKNWRDNNLEKAREIRRKTYLKNKDVENERSRNYTLRRRIQVLKVYGGENPKCKQCECSEVRILELDHINNDGKQERSELGLVGAGFYGWLIKNNYPNKDKYQILCKNCNYLKYLNIKKICA